MRNIAAVKPCSMFRLTIPLVAGIFVSDHFFQGALPVLVSGTGILGCLIGLIVLMKWQGYLSRWLFGGMVFMFLFCVGAIGNIIDSVFYGVVFNESTHSTIASFVPVCSVLRLCLWVQKVL